MTRTIMYFLLFALPACADEEASLTIRLVDADGAPAGNVRLGTHRESRPGPWFGRETPPPTMVSQDEATWKWSGLPRGTYDIRFHLEDSLWIVAVTLGEEDRREILLRTPGSTTVRGRLQDHSGPVRGTMVSALSQINTEEERIIWKNWSRTGDGGEYRLAMLPEGEDTQVFLDDETPQIPWMEGDGGADRFVHGNHFRGTEIWSGAPRDFDVGTTRLRSCDAVVELDATGYTGMKAWIFVKARTSFDYRFQQGVEWRSFREFDRVPPTLRISDLPEGEVLLVLGPGTKERKNHRFGLHRLLDLHPGKVTHIRKNSTGTDGSLETGLDGIEFGNEEEYARIKRSVVLLPEEYLAEGGRELAKAFRYAFPWKTRSMQIDHVPAGAYVCRMESTPWFDTTKAPADREVPLPLSLLLRSLGRKIESERITPEHSKFRLNPGESRRLRFRFRRVD